MDVMDVCSRSLKILSSNLNVSAWINSKGCQVTRSRTCSALFNIQTLLDYLFCTCLTCDLQFIPSSVISQILVLVDSFNLHLVRLHLYLSLNLFVNLVSCNINDGLFVLSRVFNLLVSMVIFSNGCVNFSPEQEILVSCK